MGGAWLTGGLDALARETGWDPAEADYVVGTSAGSMIGALCASGIPPWFMVAHSMGESFDESWTPTAARRRRPTAPPAPCSGSGTGRRSAPARGAWRCAACATRRATRPRRDERLAAVAGWSRPSRFRRRSAASCPRAGAPHPGLWIVACDYATGKRVAFGREDAARGRPRRRRRRLVRDPGLLPARHDRSGPLCRRRDPLDLEPRRAARPRARPRDLPQPDLDAAPDARGAQPFGGVPADDEPRVGAPARQRGQEAARRGNERRPDPADAKRPRRDGQQPDGDERRNEAIAMAQRRSRPSCATRATPSCSPGSPRARRRRSAGPTISRRRAGRACRSCATASPGARATAPARPTATAASSQRRR